MAVVGQEHELKHEQDEDRRDRQCDPRHGLQQPTEPASALARGAGENLREQRVGRSEEHTSELQSQSNLVCRLLLEKKKHYSLMYFIKGKKPAIFHPDSLPIKTCGH